MRHTALYVGAFVKIRPDNQYAHQSGGSVGYVTQVETGSDLQLFMEPNRWVNVVWGKEGLGVNGYRSQHLEVVIEPTIYFTTSDFLIPESDKDFLDEQIIKQGSHYKRITPQDSLDAVNRLLEVYEKQKTLNTFQLNYYDELVKTRHKWKEIVENM